MRGRHNHGINVGECRRRGEGRIKQTPGESLMVFWLHCTGVECLKECFLRILAQHLSRSHNTERGCVQDACLEKGLLFSHITKAVYSPYTLTSKHVSARSICSSFIEKLAERSKHISPELHITLL